MKRLTVQAKIEKVQESIEELYKKLNEPNTCTKPKSIQKKILKLYEELYVLEAQTQEHTIICPVCKKEFTPSQSNSVCCSTKCYNHYYYLQKTIAKRAEIRKNKTPQEVICKECGKTFLTETLKNKFCSEECKKEYLRKYNATYREANKKRISELQANYRKTEKYKATRKRYAQSEKGKATLKKYQQSEKYKSYVKKYYKQKKLNNLEP